MGKLCSKDQDGVELDASPFRGHTSIHLTDDDFYAPEPLTLVQPATTSSTAKCRVLSENSSEPSFSSAVSWVCSSGAICFGLCCGCALLSLLDSVHTPTYSGGMYLALAAAYTCVLSSRAAVLAKVSCVSSRAAAIAECALLYSVAALPIQLLARLICGWSVLGFASGCWLHITSALGIGCVGACLVGAPGPAVVHWLVGVVPYVATREYVLPASEPKATAAAGPASQRSGASDEFEEQLGNAAALERRFTAAAAFARATDMHGLESHGMEPSTSEKLDVYKLYKQATEGDYTNGKQPGLFNITGKVKYSAWKGLCGMSRQVAMQKYVEVMNHLRVKFAT